MSTKRPIFLDLEVQQRFERDGYVVIKAIDNQAVKHLNELHDKLFIETADLPHCYNTSDHLTSLQEKKLVSQEINALFSTFYKENLSEYRSIYSNFIGKSPGKNSSRELHQDYSFCDERLYDGYNIWVPLQDITEHNSFFGLVKHSHLFFESFRGREIPHRFEHHHQYITKELTTGIFPKAGEALIYNTATLHYTPDNISNATRVAVSMMSIPSEADVNLFQGCSEKVGFVERYAVDEDFLLEYPAWRRIENLNADEIVPYDSSEISLSAFKKQYKRYNKNWTDSWWSKLLAMRS